MNHLDRSTELNFGNYGSVEKVGTQMQAQQKNSYHDLRQEATDAMRPVLNECWKILDHADELLKDIQEQFHLYRPEQFQELREEFYRSPENIEESSYKPN